MATSKDDLTQPKWCHGANPEVMGTSGCTECTGESHRAPRGKFTTEVKEKPKEENVMSLQETIAATIAAAMVPFQQQLDRLNADMQVMQSLQSTMLVDEGQGEKRGASTAESRPPLRLRVT